MPANVDQLKMSKRHRPGPNHVSSDGIFTFKGISEAITGKDLSFLICKAGFALY
jgi:hypothetical protein